MRKILIIALREYRTAVRTKSFIIGLLIAPILMGGGMAAFLLLKDRVDTSDIKMVVIDHSGLLRDVLTEAVKDRNKNQIFNQETGEKIRPAYLLEFVEPDTSDPVGQRLALSDRVRTRELHAFIEIGPGILHPEGHWENAFIKYYSEHAFMDEVRYWFSNPINNYLRDVRVEELKLDPDLIKDLFVWLNVQGMGLINIDRKTGDLKDAEQTNELQSFLVPYFIVLLMFMMVMMSAVPLLSAVMEEKLERIAEVLLGSITPFQFMMGKILGSISVSLTTASIYVIGGVITARQVQAGELIPYEVLPWFFIFLVLFVIMVGSLMAALGSACNDNKDAQSLQFPAMIPVILPLFILVPIIQNPISPLSTWLSLFPPFTPTLMLMRMAGTVTIPAWQPWTGLAGVVLFTALSMWIGGRIFRTGILMQGQKPTLGNLVRYALKK